MDDVFTRRLKASLDAFLMPDGKLMEIKRWVSDGVVECELDGEVREYSREQLRRAVPLNLDGNFLKNVIHECVNEKCAGPSWSAKLMSSGEKVLECGGCGQTIPMT